MDLTFVHLRTYVADARRLGLTDEDQRELEKALLARPTAGAVMAGTGGLRKLRHAPHVSGRGKSGGIRVCYAHVPAQAQVYFVVAFGKNEQANLSAAQKKAIRALLREIGEQLERKSQ